MPKASPTASPATPPRDTRAACYSFAKWAGWALLASLAPLLLYVSIHADAYLAAGGSASLWDTNASYARFPGLVTALSQLTTGVVAAELPSPATRRRVGPPPIAILVMLPSDPMPWAKVLGALDTNSEVEAYFFMWQSAPTAETVAAANDTSRGVIKAVWHTPGTVWSTGRNALAKAAYAAEVARGAKYRYWVFFDEEIVICTGCNTSHVGEPACCMDYMIRDVLLGPYNFAMVGIHVGPTKVNPEPFSDAQSRSFEMHDCPDAKLAAIHRDAAPVLLPYVPDLDQTIGWWSSQIFI